MGENKNEQSEVKTPAVLSKFKPFLGAQADFFNAPTHHKSFLIRGKGF